LLKDGSGAEVISALHREPRLAPRCCTLNSGWWWGLTFRPGQITAGRYHWNTAIC